MSYASTLERLNRTDQLEKLSWKSKSKTEVKALQNVLYELGYGEALNWAKYGADGDYAGSTTAAMEAFLKNNDFEGDGKSVSADAAQKMSKLYNVVDDLRALQSAIDEDEVEDKFFRGSRQKADIVALQTLLNDLGYGEQLKWARYGADGDYAGGTTAAVAAYAKDQELELESDGEKLTKAMAEKIVAHYSGGLGKDWTTVEATAGGSGIESVTSSIKGKYNVVTDGDVTGRFRRFRKGNYTYGTEKMVDFINNNKELLRQYSITDSSINVMTSVSENEGNLDAVNTWDNSFMTFGMFQWTIGARHDKGELPSLLKKIKEAEPDTFRAYFQKYGLDVDMAATGNVYGYMTLDGKTMNRAQEKAQFRSPEWSFVFWNSGHNDIVKAIEVEHAVSRLKTFYWKWKINGFSLSDIITSEYGVALILDNHVNRPGYVKPCVRNAMRETGLTDPTNWTTDDEMKVINAYIKIRATYGGSPMTHANGRAAVTKKYLNNGTISAERKSFVYSEVTARDSSNIGVGKPHDMIQSEHPDIKGSFVDEFTEY